MKKPPQGPPYEVGYGKPPQQTRFQKGTSGNPTGRRRGSLNLATTLNQALKKKMTVTEDGRRKTITTLEAAIKVLINKALKGDARALQQLLAALGPLVGVEPATHAAATDANDAAVMAMLCKQFGGQNNNEPTDVS